MKKIFLLSLIILLRANIYAQNNEFQAKIMVPYPYSLVRGEVPVYGIAGGRAFSKYELSYGQGVDPKKWISILISDEEKKECPSLAKIDFSLDKTIPGNLGAWDTGLSEYEYGRHFTDLSMGTYTLKLTVTGKSGEKTEDKIVVEVGRVVLNSFGGKLESYDKKVSLIIREHSLDDSVKIFSLKPLEIGKVPISEGYKLVTEIYELNQPGETFTQNAVLKIEYDKSKISNIDNLGIFVFNPLLKDWQYLETLRSESESTLEANIASIPEKFALYGVFENKKIANKIKKAKEEQTQEPLNPILCNDTFENGFGQWRNKHGTAGASLELGKRLSKGGGYCLKLTDSKGGGNFASIVRDKPFDAERFPLVKFDYKIPQDVKIDFLIKTGGKWYDIVFTDDEKIYWDINMAKIGKIKGVTADNQWHTGEFNLYEMLKPFTNDFIVQKMDMADWDSTGFKKLEFGHNAKGASYSIDNFSIKSDRFFWQIGYNDGSSKELKQAVNGESNTLYKIGDDLSTFPALLNKPIKISFYLPKQDQVNVYLLRLKLLSDIQKVNMGQIEVFLNNALIPKEKYMYSASLDIPIEGVKAGKNVITLKNLSQDNLSLDYVSFFPLKNIPWEIDFADSEKSYETNACYLVGIDNLASHSGMISFQSKELKIIFGVSNNKTSYSLALVPKKETDFGGSLVNFRKFEIMLNGNKLKELYYSGSEEKFDLALPQNYIRKGVNILKINWTGGKDKILFSKISMNEK